MSTESSQLFRDLMASVCTPVSVVTTVDRDRPHGTTVSAFASLSVDPPMILVALDRESALLALVREHRMLGLNVLSCEQAALAATFARKGDDKFDGVEWTLRAGVPHITGAAGWLAGEVSTLVDGGDHVVALVRVLELATGDGPPLTYHNRTFGTHSVLADRR
ncbi:flavin reductase family protein [Rhodococcus oxybenzonivorans]|uniref:flavin reductase family protein n=1 Tax=Rhodococcus oxybenzonivorans TaxID=1990687 RepID=UPI002954F04A|nr:flavin reductase family protein [Rhodococcus oxybenzonivorans]MDV7353670.1 flavin reductase family protein [Rhodococcus oxybenzonivorans]